MDFIIVGLPRSRTAWLASWFSCGHIHCHHDALTTTNVGDVEEPKAINGMADTGAAFKYKELKAAYPEAKWLVIDRNKDDVAKSLIKCVGHLMTEEEMVTKLDFTQAILNQIDDCIRVKFDRINVSLEKIWDYCLGGKVEFDPIRAKLYTGMNIQII
jgi:hypothetical protein